MNKNNKEKINHPKHYSGSKYEVIDIIEDFELNFCLGNAVKYILRAGKKDNKQEDLKKSIWYLQREIEGRVHYEANIKDADKCKELGLDQCFEIFNYLKRWGGWLKD